MSDEINDQNQNSGETHNPPDTTATPAVPEGPTFAAATGMGAAPASSRTTAQGRPIIENDLPTARRRGPAAEPVDAVDDEDDSDLEIDDILAPEDEEIRIPIHARSKSGKTKVAYICLRPNDPKTFRKFQTIFTGGIGGKQMRQMEANNFLFGEKYVRCEGFRPPWQNDEGKRYTDELDWFKRSRRGQIMVHASIGKYISEEIPDTDDIKG